MYIPAGFRLSERSDVVDSLRSIGVGHLVTAEAGGFDGSFIPILVDAELVTARGHLARANPQWRAIGESGCSALLIVTGVQAYVSPSWYPTKAETGEVVPTWNYEVIHLHGRVRVVDTVEFVADVVRELTDQHEDKRPTPWSVDDAPAGYLARMHRAIVGFEMSIERVEAKRKLSQNRSVEDRVGVVKGLAQGNPSAQQMSVVMKELDR